MQIPRYVMIYLPNLLLKFHSESEIRAKIILKHAKSKIWAKVMDKSAVNLQSKFGQKCFQNPPICWPIHPPLRKNKRLLVAFQRVIMRPL